MVKREKKSGSSSRASASPKRVKQNRNLIFKPEKKLIAPYDFTEDNLLRAIKTEDLLALNTMLMAKRELLDSERPISPLALAIGIQNELIIMLFISSDVNLNSVNVLIEPTGSDFKCHKRSPLGLAYEHKLSDELIKTMIQHAAHLHEDEKKKFQKEHDKFLAYYGIEEVFLQEDMPHEEE